MYFRDCWYNLLSVTELAGAFPTAQPPTKTLEVEQYIRYSYLLWLTVAKKSLRVCGAMGQRGSWTPPRVWPVSSHSMFTNPNHAITPSASASLVPIVINNNNVGCPYLKCVPCYKFLVFNDTRGNDPNDPLCYCGVSSKRQSSRARSPSLPWRSLRLPTRPVISICRRWKLGATRHLLRMLKRSSCNF